MTSVFMGLQLTYYLIFMILLEDPYYWDPSYREMFASMARVFFPVNTG